jgi:hypothetical protein
MQVVGVVEFLTPYQLHKRWGGAISPKTLANWRVKGMGPRWVKIGGRIVYPMSCVLEFESRDKCLMEAR